MKIENNDNIINSLQVTRLGDIPTGDFTPDEVFLIKNNTGEDIEVEIIPAKQTESVTTILNPGWNPEICRAIINAPAGLQYGL